MSTVRAFRCNRTLVVDAIQVRLPDGAHEIAGWLGVNEWIDGAWNYDKKSGRLLCGDEEVPDGDWLVRMGGKLRAIDGDVFPQVFELVPEPSPSRLMENLVR